MEQLVGRPLEERLDLERRVQRLDDPPGARPAALHDSGHVRLLLRQARAGQVDPGDLEQRDVFGTQLAVPTCGLDQARQQARPQDGELGGEGLRQCQGACVLVVGTQRRRVRLGEPEAGQDVLDATSELLHRRQRAEHLPPLGQRERDLLEPEARDLLDDVDLARHVARAERGHDDVAVAALEAEPLEPARLLGGRRLDADQLVGALRPERDHRALGQLALDVDVPDPLGAGRRHDQLGRELCRLLGQVRVDAFLPAVRALGAQPQALGGAVEAGRLEVRGLEQDVGRPVADLGLLAAHDSRDRDCPLGVGDHEVGLLEAAVDAVERPDRLARLGAADDDLPAGERAQIERVQRVPEREHDVVRRVDDVRDRPHAGGVQARLQPDRRRCRPSRSGRAGRCSADSLRGRRR